MKMSSIRKESGVQKKSSAGSPQRKSEKEKAEFLHFLKKYSKEELITLLQEYVSRSAEILGKQDRLIAEQGEMIKLLDKGNSGSFKRVRQAIDYIKETNKQIEYLENIAAQRKLSQQKAQQNLEKNLGSGREKSNKNRHEKSEKLKKRLELAVRDYFVKNTNHKISNPELFLFLGQWGFMGPDGYKKKSTFERAVALAASAIRNEKRGQ